MNRRRVIPVLLLKSGGLYKTRHFRKPVYIGDPINTVRIFNDKEVDELILLDIEASMKQAGPDFQRIGDIVSESFMPVAYGGGITRREQALQLFDLGVEKIILGTSAFRQPELIGEIAATAGSQAVVASIDVKHRLLGSSRVFVRSGTLATGADPIAYAKAMAAAGAGEIMLTSIAQEGSMQGFDIGLLKGVTGAVDIPVIAHGGAGSLAHFAAAIRDGHASAVAAGSFFVFQGPHRAVLISYPSPAEIESLGDGNSLSQ